LGQTLLARLQDSMVGQRPLLPRTPVKSRPLVGIRAITEVFGLFETLAQEHLTRGKIAGVFGGIHFLDVLVSHGSSFQRATIRATTATTNAAPGIAGPLRSPGAFSFLADSSFLVFVSTWF